MREDIKIAKTFPYFSNVRKPAPRKINSSETGPKKPAYKNIVTLSEPAEADSMALNKLNPKIFNTASNI